MSSMADEKKQKTAHQTSREESDVQGRSGMTASQNNTHKYTTGHGAIVEVQEQEKIYTLKVCQMI